MSHRHRSVALALLALALACDGRELPASAEPGAFEGDGLRVEVFMPAGDAREGMNELRFRVRDAGGAPVDDARVGVAYSMAMAGMAPMGGNVTAEPIGEGEYRAEVALEMAGTWQIALAAERASGARARAEGSLRTGAAGLRLEAAAAAPAEDPDAVSHYTCPMHPSVHEAHPGKCPLCGMDLVPVRKGEAKSGEVRVDPARLQQIGVRFATVERAPLVRTIRATGTVVWDETKLVDVSLKVGGWVRELHADALGARVNAGDPLFAVYSPSLYAAQLEYLDALRAQASARATSLPQRGDALVRAARERLRLWDIAERDIAALAQRGEPFEAVPVRARASGFVIEKNLVAGAAFEPGVRLFRIAPLDRVWIDAQVFESDAPLLSVGQTALVRAPSLAGGELEAQVAYVYPSLDTGTRTARARLELANPGLTLRPGMWVEVELRAELGPRVLVPVSAVIYAGARRVVFVDRGEGRLEPRTVQTGSSGDERIEILSGLEPGERIVASGNFLIAAESRIKSALSQW